MRDFTANITYSHDTLFNKNTHAIIHSKVALIVTAENALDVMHMVNDWYVGLLNEAHKPVTIVDINIKRKDVIHSDDISI